jgi:hypothetical protein
MLNPELDGRVNFHRVESFAGGPMNFTRLVTRLQSPFDGLCSKAD